MSKLSWCMDWAVFSIASSARVKLPWRMRYSMEGKDISGEMSLSGRWMDCSWEMRWEAAILSSLGYVNRFIFFTSE